MKKYKKIKKLEATEFRRLTGVKPETFLEMVAILQQAETTRMSRGGKPHRLAIEDRLLMALEYLREYRTYFHLGKSYDLSESACYRSCRWIEDTLIKSSRFSLPGKKALLKNDVEFEVVLIDAAESPIERPKKKGSSQEANKKAKQQTEALLLREEKKAYPKKPSCGG
jgi:hypothetical protein